jgi:hypothetical protein
LSKALIDPNSLILNSEAEILGYRIVQIAISEFPVAPPLFWTDCTSSVDQNTEYYDPTTQEFKPLPPVEPTAAQNRTTAIQLLRDTDWVNEPDVYNTANTPHLLNRQEFLDYRIVIRPYAVNPVAGNINWPTKPVEQWST